MFLAHVGETSDRRLGNHQEVNWGLRTDVVESHHLGRQTVLHCNSREKPPTSSSSKMIFAGISFLAILPKMVSPPGLAPCAFSVSLAIPLVRISKSRSEEQVGDTKELENVVADELFGTTRPNCNPTQNAVLTALAERINCIER